MSELNGPKKETVRITLPPRVPPGGSVGGGPATAKPEPPKRVLPPPPPPSRKVPPPPSSIPAASTPASPAPAPPAAPLSAPPPPPPVAPPPPPAPPVAAAPTPPPAPPAMPARPRILPPPPRVSPPRVTPSSVADAPANYPGSGTEAGPRKETARITILPEPARAMAATVKMAKTQPLQTVPGTQAPYAPVTVAPDETEESESSTGLLEMLEHVPLPICWTIFAISSVTLLIQIWNYFSS